MTTTVAREGRSTPGELLVSVAIDGVEVQVAAGTSVVEAARRAGVEIPVFCHHPYLEPVGTCRMCLVEIGTPGTDPATGGIERDASGAPVVRFRPKLEPGCTTVVTDGMVVRTATPEVSAQRRAVLEFLLSSHPLDCPVCDKGGECPLQNLTLRYGPGTSRFDWSDKYRFEKPTPLGPLVVLDRERCVLCTRCVRFQEELAGDGVLALESRGRGTEVVSVSDPPFRSVFSGNTTDICPVGALTTVEFRLAARVWELVGRPSVCVHCSVGCNLMLDTRHGKVLRAMPRRNDAVNGIWLCDKGRFGHRFAGDPERLDRPLVRRSGQLVAASWDEALGYVAGRLLELRAAHGAAAIGGIAGDHLPNEDLYLFGRFLRAVIGTNNVDHWPGVVRDDSLQRAGAGAGTRWADLGPGSLVLVVGLDAHAEAPMLALQLRQAWRQGARVAVVSGRSTGLDELAGEGVRYRFGAERETVRALVDAVVGGGRPRETGDLPAGLASAARAVRGARDLLVLYGPEAQRAGLVGELVRLALATGHARRANNGLVAVGAHANGQGAADMGLLPDRLPGYHAVTDARARARLHEVWPGAIPLAGGLGARQMLSGGVRGLLVLGTDPLGDGLVDGAVLAGIELLVVQELYLTATASRAQVVLPALSVAEREGTFTNLLRQVQRFLPAVPGPGEARADWQVLRELTVRLGVAEPLASEAQVFEEIARVVPEYRGLGYAPIDAWLGRAPEGLRPGLAPRTEARAVEYLGTVYETAFGAGLRADKAAGGGEAGRDGEAEEQARAQEGDDGGVGHGEALAMGAPGTLLLVPVPRLYDEGTMIRPAAVLHPLVCRAQIVISPAEARRLGLADGDRATIAAPGGRATVFVRTDVQVPEGVVLAPQGMTWAPPIGVLLAGRRVAAVEVEALGD